MAIDRRWHQKAGAPEPTPSVHHVRRCGHPPLDPGTPDFQSGSTTVSTDPGSVRCSCHRSHQVAVWLRDGAGCRVEGRFAVPDSIRLCDRGLLESRWESDPPQGRPPRHLHRLTDTGIRPERDTGLPHQPLDHQSAEQTSTASHQDLLIVHRLLPPSLLPIREPVRPLECESENTLVTDCQRR